ncbi:NAD-glutamate dehydrogenase [Permianibacter sp. IMCC34836]|uniref:NAD-glutamate dehydrogenase n=1 Tax=Permianibacter fluminis TaxID=2738515 RepID=UPI0015516483|nr:NAD-glutamate dehydrogenase [Permianibacter fluminis]NQD37258.1 NAD-glutamate dehydrogenase [Permianibacter fluminis]
MPQATSANSSAQSNVVIDGVIQALKARLPAKQVALAGDFARLFYSSVSEEDLARRSAADLAAIAANLWQYLQDYQSGRAAVRVSNPSQSKEGWQTRNTVIELNVDDMPFLVDSVRMELNRLGLTAHLHVHRPMRIQRGKDGRIEKVEKITTLSGAGCETPMFIEIDHIADAGERKQLEQDLLRVLGDVRLTVSGYQSMREKLDSINDELSKNPPAIAPATVAEARDFLKWLLDDHFIFMGYRAYDVEKIKGDYKLNPVRKSSLGLLSKDDASAQPVVLSTLSPDAQKVALNNEELVVLTKTRTLSSVHRPGQIDYIGIKRYNDKGDVVGEHRFFGLYASTVYNRSPRNIPVMRKKILEVVERSGLVPNSHDFKALRDIIETFPRDELFQMSSEELLAIGMGVLYIKERPIVRLFVRRDPYGRFFSCFVYVPRELHNTKLRLKMQAILAKHLGAKADEIRFSTWFSDSILARVHFVVPVENAGRVKYDVKAMETELRDASVSWDEQVKEAVVAQYGDAEGKKLAAKYQDAFHVGYQDENSAAVALEDIKHLESLSDSNPLAMQLYAAPNAEQGALRFKLYQRLNPAPLSDVLPMLENMGLTVIGETPYEVERKDGSVCWIMDFGLQPQNAAALDLNAVKDVFQQAFAETWAGKTENDGFNRLVLTAGLNWREVSVLRAFAKYFWQIGFTFSQSSIEQTLAAYPQIARKIVEWFNARFEPGKANEKKAHALLDEIKAERAKVATLDQDRIVSRYLDVINATLRTNFFQPGKDGEAKAYISFKLKPAKIPDIPKPVPMFEIWVYSPRVEGVHLRFGKVARGGLRWSDRRDDFRTEVLGLVKAQQVKNTVIVPNGAKGGFFCKQMPKTTDRKIIQAEGIACYQMFIRGLLDITDNIVAGKIIAPHQVVRHDEADPYLVVAADKGTATFSDIANAISLEYNHWLGDAFASGGSNGYDHKGMGITARGAWECVKRHFREIGKDIQNEDFTVTGVGDMSGDVFGNGMLLSKHIRLLAAFDHRHIFLDPNPDASKSFVERQRLFNLPTSSWDDYDKKLISKGGGVFPRSAKSIPLSAEVQAMLGVKQSEMAPPELMHTILKMEVELFWNGGIGTYVKAASQRHNEVGDRANDAIRVDGRELRAKVVGEGGNLGMTQLGRIEYMLNGGRGNTDFIDNAGGVNTSDNEVNIKILLNALVTDGSMTEKQRNKLLADMTDDVGSNVLKDNYRQSQSISVTESRAASMVKEHIRFIHQLEREGRLDRALEYLPSDDEMQERLVKGKGLTRAELAILTSYGKMSLKDQLNVPEVVEDVFYRDMLASYFPPLMRNKYAEPILQHRLKNEIIAMQLANDMVNFGGANFAHRMVDETGVSFAEVASCFTLAREVFAVDKFWEQLEALDNKVPAALQLDAMHESQRLIRRAARWFMRQRRKNAGLAEEIARFKPAVDVLRTQLPKLLEASEAADLAGDSQRYIERGLPKKLAEELAFMSTLFSALDIAEVAEELQQPVALVAETYFKLGFRTDLHWFLSQIVRQPVENHWQAFARSAFREELDWQQRQLTGAVLKLTGKDLDANSRLENWLQDNAEAKRWLQLLTEFRTSSAHEFAKFSVALRELGILVQSCQRQVSAGVKVKAAKATGKPASNTASKAASPSKSAAASKKAPAKAAVTSKAKSGKASTGSKASASKKKGDFRR